MKSETRGGWGGSNPAKRPIEDETRVVVELRPDKQLNTEAKGLATRAAQMIVDSIEAAKAAKVFLQGVIALRRKIESHYDEIKKPLNATRAKILDMEKRDLEPVYAVERAITTKVYDFESAEERRRREAARIEAERRTKEEADRRAREAKALEEQARSVRNRADKAALREQAAAIVEAPLPEIAVAHTAVKADAKVDGMKAVTTWSGEVVDLAAFVKAVADGRAPLEAIEVDAGWLRKQASALADKLGQTYPGLVARSKTTYVSK